MKKLLTRIIEREYDMHLSRTSQKIPSINLLRCRNDVFILNSVMTRGSKQQRDSTAPGGDIIGVCGQSKMKDMPTKGCLEEPVQRDARSSTVRAFPELINQAA